MKKKCRVCLEEALKLYPMNAQIINCDQDISTMIKCCTSIEVQICNDLPDGVCILCFKTLRIAYNFIIKFKENNIKLLQEREKLYLNNKIKDVTELVPTSAPDEIYEINNVKSIDISVQNTRAAAKKIKREVVQLEVEEEVEDEIECFSMEDIHDPTHSVDIGLVEQETYDQSQEEDEESVQEEESQDQSREDDEFAVAEIDHEIVEEQEMYSQELVEIHEIEGQEDDEEEYEYQEVEAENLGAFLHSLSENCTSTSSENYPHNVTIVKTRPIIDDNAHKPQTVLRRKIKIRFTCPLCPTVHFASFENGLLPHMSLHEETFQCNVCMDGTIYNSDSFLNHFMKFHRYQCPYCGKSFNRTGTLTSHIKTHSTFRYHCSAEGCPKSFPTSWTLKKHEAVHSSKNAYFCIDCNLPFKTYDTYMYHQKKHGGKKFLCMCCGKTFMQSVHLKYHMQQHTGIKHFKCDQCEKSYTSSSQLKKHKRRHHPEELENLWVVEQQEFEDII